MTSGARDGASRETLRLFVAGELPSAVVAEITAWQAEQLASRRELRVNKSLHLTLCFLGAVSRDAVADIVAALHEVRFSAAPLRPVEVVFLPDRGLKRVVALRFADATGALGRLQSEVSASLAALGVYEPERRPYLPHLTVARFRRQGHPFSLQNVTITRFLMERMVLYSSLLERVGAVHTPLEIFPAS
jgi:2'-5' RNA ligase